MAGLVPFNKKGGRLVNSSFDDFYNMLDDFFTDNFLSRKSFGKDTFRVDVQEKEKEYIVEADLPGVNKEDIGIELDDGRLNIVVKKEENTEKTDINYIHKERRSTSMYRSIYLQDALDDNASAKLENGVLTINIPKQEKIDNSKQIKIE
ncbi:MAG: Hsp20/alpha crystallin family protein [Tissierellaceae bacterium]